MNKWKIYLMISGILFSSGWLMAIPIYMVIHDMNLSALSGIGLSALGMVGMLKTL